ncbi:pyruvate kinase [Brevibacterium sanguinis]|uniref:Pyruvate kinase n=2 Tax=Brevibacterium TaxID=1696 RepID=A0A366IIJ6_9MICO|nr:MULTISPECIES: pyruvate kinase [Brevibacterium]RBP61614.1 pyruvate kinase [Brevibacterium sanguinis]RBP70866.1 pyruvate kinase [Brevibacterium celere]
MRRAKIVATLGPNQSSYEEIRALVDEGVDVARFNLSHGDREQHEEKLAWVRRAAADTGRAVAVLLDLQGPKIRVGRFANGREELVEGATFTITSRDVEGTSEIVSTTLTTLPNDVSVGDPLLIDDGRLRLRATAVTETDVVTEVEIGGPISNNKGINLPGVPVSVPALSDKDVEDLKWGLRLGFDWVALSFVRSPDDAEDVHRVMREVGISAPVIAKLEKPQAVEALAEIIDAFDGIMVARGDLGVELPLEQVPIVQKRAVELARRQAKPVIVATQMLETMIDAARPTRAEASDCANAVLDGADALMLSGETSVGQYWIEAIRTMSRIIESTEVHGLDRIPPLGTVPHTKGGAVTAAAVRIAEQLDIDLLCTFSQTGDSVRRMARLRPVWPILGFTPDAQVRHQLALTWGVHPYLVKTVRHTDQMARQVDAVLLADGTAREGDQSIIVAGSPPGIPGSTNALRIHTMGDAAKGVAAAYEDDSDNDEDPLAGYGIVPESPDTSDVPIVREEPRA